MKQSKYSCAINEVSIVFDTYAHEYIDNKLRHLSTKGPNIQTHAQSHTFGGYSMHISVKNYQTQNKNVHQPSIELVLIQRQ